MRRRIGESGHQVIPATARSYVHRELAELCARLGPRLLGITCLAAGADQMFAEAVLAAGGQVHVVVPSRQYEGSFDDPVDLRRFRQLLGRAESREVLAFEMPSEAAYLAAGQRVVDLADEVVAIWDRLPARGLGGTADIVQYAHDRRRPVTVVWPPGVER